MKKYLICVAVFLIALTLTSSSCRQSPQSSSNLYIPNVPIAIEDQKDLFQAGRFYFGGQPDAAMLGWLKDQGVEVVINLRTKDEIETHTKEHFDELLKVEELGMTYLNFPMGGDVGYSPEVVDTFSRALELHKGKALIHCAVGVRASYLWVAYLVRHKNVPLDEAIDIGKKMKFKFFLEDLLGYPLSMRRRE